MLPTGFAFPLVNPVSHFLGVLPDDGAAPPPPPDDGAAAAGSGAAAGASCSSKGLFFLTGVCLRKK